MEKINLTTEFIEKVNILLDPFVSRRNKVILMRGNKLIYEKNPDILVKNFTPYDWTGHKDFVYKKYLFSASSLYECIKHRIPSSEVKLVHYIGGSNLWRFTFLPIMFLEKEHIIAILTLTSDVDDDKLEELHHKNERERDELIQHCLSYLTSYLTKSSENSGVAMSLNSLTEQVSMLANKNFRKNYPILNVLEQCFNELSKQYKFEISYLNDLDASSVNLPPIVLSIIIESLFQSIFSKFDPTLLYLYFTHRLCAMDGKLVSQLQLSFELKDQNANEHEDFIRFSKKVKDNNYLTSFTAFLVRQFDGYIKIPSESRSVDISLYFPVFSEDISKNENISILLSYTDEPLNIKIPYGNLNAIEENKNATIFSCNLMSIIEKYKDNAQDCPHYDIIIISNLEENIELVNKYFTLTNASTKIVLVNFYQKECKDLDFDSYEYISELDDSQIINLIDEMRENRT